jgi:hypothetical protein
MKSLLYFLLFFIISIIAFRCSDEPDEIITPAPTEKPIWENDDSFFRTDKIILNAQVDSGKFLIAGVSRVSMYDSATGTRHSSNASNNRTIDYKPAITFPYVMYFGNNNFQLIINSPAYMRVFGGNTGGFPFTDELRFSDFNLGYSENAKVTSGDNSAQNGAFNNKNQFLTLIDDSELPELDYSFCLIELNPTESIFMGYPALTLNPVPKRINLNTDISEFIRVFEAIDDMFYVQIQSGIYVINSFGDVVLAQGLNTLISDFYLYNDTLFAFAPFFGSIYYSNDKGYNWNFYVNGLPQYLLKFFEVEGKLCFYIYSQIAWIDFENNTIIELDNEGLEGNEITSVNKFGETVWVTTLSGMFKKDVKDFFTKKEIKSSKTLGGKITYNKTD